MFVARARSCSSCTRTHDAVSRVRPRRVNGAARKEARKVTSLSAHQRDDAAAGTLEAENSCRGERRKWSHIDQPYTAAFFPAPRACAFFNFQESRLPPVGKEPAQPGSQYAKPFPRFQQARWGCGYPIPRHLRCAAGCELRAPPAPRPVMAPYRAAVAFVALASPALANLDALKVSM